MLFRAEGIVIRTTDYGESDKIVTLFTRPYGKTSVMARGAKKVKSRHAAAAQLFTYGEFIYFKSGQMGTLNHGEISHAYRPLREHLQKAAYGAYLLELTDRMTDDGEPDAGLFDQLKGSLDALEAGKDMEIVAHIYEMKMLASSGYRPVLDGCVCCGGAVGDDAALSVSQGGALCARCKNVDPAAIPCSPTVLKLLRLFAQIDVRRLGNVDVKPGTKAELKRCLLPFFDAYVDVKWKTRRFIDQMEKYGI